MQRYVRIESITFDGTALPLPMSLRLSRRTQPLPATGEGEVFATSVQMGAATIGAKVRLRGVAAAEDMTLGRCGQLTGVISAADGSHNRTVRLDRAVLVAVEHAYEQSTTASAVLRFVAEAPDGSEEPFAVEETP